MYDRANADCAKSRARGRGDRMLGGAQTFYDAAHRCIEYDIEIDTSQLDARHAALRSLKARKGQRRAARALLERLHHR